MDKTIVTAFLVVAGVVSAVLVFNSIYPALLQSRDAMTSMEHRMDERLKSQIEIIHAAKSGSQALIWVKNVGALRLVAVEMSDVFFGPEGNFVRVPYGLPGSSGLHWEYSVENGGEWVPTATIRITVVNYPSLPAGRYLVKVTLPNGVSDDYFFSW